MSNWGAKAAMLTGLLWALHFKEETKRQAGSLFIVSWKHKATKWCVKFSDDQLKLSWPIYYFIQRFTQWRISQSHASVFLSTHGPADYVNKFSSSNTNNGHAQSSCNFVAPSTDVEYAVLKRNSWCGDVRFCMFWAPRQQFVFVLTCLTRQRPALQSRIWSLVGYKPNLLHSRYVWHAGTKPLLPTDQSICWHSPWRHSV